jgi:PLP dependent protein
MHLSNNIDSKPSAQKLLQVQDRIAQACLKAGRAVDSVRLLAVSKTFDLPSVLALAEQGQVAFGENYVQETVAKYELWRQTSQQLIEWHFIGPLQSNKTRPIAQTVDWVHSIDRIKIAQRLSEQRPSDLRPLQVCVQVNVSGEASKSGCSLDEISTISDQIMTLPGLVLRGLMAIPEAMTATEQGAPNDSLLRQYELMFSAFKQLQTRHGKTIDTLSMGMSADLEPAIAHGATMVRVGSALFGQRA